MMDTIRALLLSEWFLALSGSIFVIFSSTLLFKRYKTRQKNIEAEKNYLFTTNKKEAKSILYRYIVSNDYENLNRFLKQLQNETTKEQFNEYVEYFNKNGRSNFVCLAARFGTFQTLEVLLRFSFSINAVDGSGDSPIHLAARSGRLECLRILIPLSDVNCVNKQGWTPLHWTSVNGRLACTSLLLKNGANTMMRAESHNRVALHLAAQNGHVGDMELLLRFGNKDAISCRDSAGNTPILLTARNGSVNALTLLLSYGGSVYDKNDSGMSVVTRAATRGFYDYVIKLLETDRSFTINQLVILLTTPTITDNDNGEENKAKGLKNVLKMIVNDGRYVEDLNHSLVNRILLISLYLLSKSSKLTSDHHFFDLKNNNHYSSQNTINDDNNDDIESKSADELKEYLRMNIQYFISFLQFIIETNIKVAEYVIPDVIKRFERLWISLEDILDDFLVGKQVQTIYQRKDNIIIIENDKLNHHPTHSPSSPSPIPPLPLEEKELSEINEIAENVSIVIDLFYQLSNLNSIFLNNFQSNFNNYYDSENEDYQNNQQLLMINKSSHLSLRGSQEIQRKARDQRFEMFIDKYVDFFHYVIQHNSSLLLRCFSFILENCDREEWKFRELSSLLSFDDLRGWLEQKLREIRDQHNNHNNGADDQNFTITVHRDNHQILHDSCSFLNIDDSSFFKRNFIVSFEGEAGRGVGVRREWFQLITKELFNADNGLFIQSADGNFQPNHQSSINPDHLPYFKFAGRVVALAIYHHEALDVHFTRPFYKHILQLPIVYTDIEFIDPEYYRNLKWIVENDVEDLGLTFSAEWNEFGIMQVIDLIEDGRHISVNNQNKIDYINLVTTLRMTKSIEQQICSFREGFHDIIPRHLISFFNENQLELLISGLPKIDLDDWKDHTTYSSYSSDDQQIIWFWHVVDQMSEVERENLLQYVTGSPRVSIDGFANIDGKNGKFTIVKGGDVHSLPTASTCFNLLKLPEYTSQEELKEKLLMAISHGRTGFDFI